MQHRGSMALTSLRRFVALSLVGMLAAGSALAEERTADAVLILDSSAGMAAKLANSRKSILTRAAVPAALAAHAGRINLGLIAYGHRKRKDCKTIESLLPLQPLDAKRLSRAIGAVRPRGQAPLADAIRAGAGLLAEAPGPRSMIVVAGASDSCGQDPCAVASELAAAKPGITIHVVGIAVPEASVAAVQCIADATGGRFSNAVTGDEISQSVGELLALVARTADEPEPPPVPLAPELALSASLAPDGAALEEAIAWRVSRGADVLYEGNEARPRVALAAGTYTVTASLGTVTASQDVTVAPTGRTEVAMPLDAAALRIRAVSGPDLAPVTGVSYTLYRSDAGTPAPEVVAVSRDPAPSFVLRPGSYRVLVEQGLARVERTLTLEAGRDVTETVELLTGTLTLEARATLNSAPLDGVFFFVTEDDPEAPGGQREVARSAASQPSFTLPAGSYHVQARQGRAAARTTVALRAGQETRQIVEMSTALLLIDSPLPEPSAEFGAGWTVVVTALDPLTGTESEVERTTRRNPRLALPAGKYRVTGRLGTVNAAVSQEITLRAGQDQAVTFEPRAGFVELTLGSEDGAGRDVLWELKDSNGNRVLSTTAHNPKVALAPGDYRVTVTHQKKQVVTAFSLADGERKAVALTLE